MSWPYSAADRRLDSTDPAQVSDFRHAVAGRALALIAGPDAPADDIAILSRAWTTAIG